MSRKEAASTATSSSDSSTPPHQKNKNKNKTFFFEIAGSHEDHPIGPMGPQMCICQMSKRAHWAKMCQMGRLTTSQDPRRAPLLLHETPERHLYYFTRPQRGIFTTSQDPKGVPLLLHKTPERHLYYFTRPQSDTFTTSRDPRGMVYYFTGPQAVSVYYFTRPSLEPKLECEAGDVQPPRWNASFVA